MILVCLCRTIKDISEVPKGYVAELKLDGIRCLALCGNDFILVNRYGRIVSFDYPEIQINFNGVLDGEIVIFDKYPRTNFNLLQNHKNNGLKAVYVVFDVLKYGNIDLRNKPLFERQKYLSKIKGENIISILDIKTPSWSEVVKQNYEGLIYKNPYSIYDGKRTNEWLKLKNFKEIDGEILNIAVSKKADGFVIDFKPNLINATIQRVAVQLPRYRQIISEKIGKEKLKAVIQFLDLTKDNRLRMPTFKELVGY